MEFSFSVNKILPRQLTLIQSKDITSDETKEKHCEDEDIKMKANLSAVVDRMGEASALAQNLREAITSSSQMKRSQHRLYILKEENANNGLGCVIGMIKVGYKHLFLMDSSGQYHECEPLCVLDFYVHESKQRHGYGKIIFQHMLLSEQILPHQLAIDRPSSKFINFLSKHYSLDKPIHQGNRFTVFNAFFKETDTRTSMNNNENTFHSPTHSKTISNASFYQDHSAEKCINNLDNRRLFHPFPDNRTKGRIDTNWNLFGVPGIS